MTIYGYARISSPQQNIERQIRNIKEYSLKEFAIDPLIFSETWTGSTMERPMYKKLLSVLRKGDVVVFDSVCRMSRTAEEGCREYFNLYDKGINLIFLKESAINTENYTEALSITIPMTDTDVDLILEGVQKFMKKLAQNQIRASFEQAQKELEDLHQRTREGMLIAAQNGKQIGRKVGTKIQTKQSIEVKARLLRDSIDFGGYIRDVDLIKILGVSPATYYKYKRELKNQMSN